MPAGVGSSWFSGSSESGTLQENASLQPLSLKLNSHTGLWKAACLHGLVFWAQAPGAGAGRSGQVCCEHSQADVDCAREVSARPHQPRAAVKLRPANTVRSTSATRHRRIATGIISAVFTASLRRTTTAVTSKKRLLLVPQTHYLLKEVMERWIKRCCLFIAPYVKLPPLYATPTMPKSLTADARTCTQAHWEVLFSAGPLTPL